jgi:hypothetical protein
LQLTRARAKEVIAVSAYYDLLIIGSNAHVAPAARG